MSKEYLYQVHCEEKSCEYKVTFSETMISRPKRTSNLVQYMSSIDYSKCYIMNFNLGLDTISSIYLAF